MKRLSLFLGLIGVIAATGAVTSRGAFAGQAEDRLDAAKLKAMINGLGYETSDLNTEVGKEKYQFKITKGSLDVPMAAEFSPSKNYIWFTVFLGASKPTLKFEDMLKRNSEIQPSQFYITSKGNLMMAIAIDNRSVSAAVMKRNVDKLADDVESTQSLWSTN